MKQNVVLVTGAAGFLGRNIAHYFSTKSWFVIGMGFDSWRDAVFKEWGIDTWITSEVSDKSLLKIGITPNLVVHCAGSGSVGYSLANPKEDFKANVESLLPILERMRLKWKRTRLIYPSSAAVYGEKGNVAIKEDDKLNPISPYGYHKKIAEELMESYSNNYNLSISVIRFFSLYGYGLEKQLMWDVCEKINKSKGAIELYGTGKETRDFINVIDAANLVHRVYESKDRFMIYNGASGLGIPVGKVAEMYIKELNKDIDIKFNGKKRGGDPAHYLADISRARQIGWSPKIRLETGIRQYINFYKTTV